MRLCELLQYDPITIQCHDNPDGDAIASAFGVYSYMIDHGKSARIIYSGKFEITKPNLVIMIKELKIPIEYVRDVRKIDGLLVTVDCQYGAGNVTKFPADQVAYIDHHQEEIEDVEIKRIYAGLGSCSTLVWKMLLEEGYLIKDMRLGTALYYGLYTDTSQLAEIYHPWDKDMRDEILFDKGMINLFRNSNMSLKELELAGMAMLRYIHNEKYSFAIIKANECDPNILGLISDILVQVDQVHIAVVYNRSEDGYKFSVRSCTKEVIASELAGYLAGKIGSGGGHIDKAGGFISMAKYDKEYPGLHTEAYFSTKLHQYFEETSVIYAQDYEIDIENYKYYNKKRIPTGYAIPSDFLEIGTPITIRTMEGDVDTVVSDELCIMIGVRGDVYPSTIDKLRQKYEVMNEAYDMAVEYKPVIKNRKSGETVEIAKFAMSCIATGKSRIMAKKLENRVKIFTEWYETKYMLGEEGDYLVVMPENHKDMYIVDHDTFQRLYDEV